MDESVKATLDSYRGMIAQYEGKLSTSHPKFVLLNDFFNQVVALGENAADYFEFAEKANAIQWMEKMNEHLTAVAMEALNQKPASDKPTVTQAAAGYHQAFEALPAESHAKEKEIYQMIFALEKECATAAEFMKRLFEEKLPLRLATEPGAAMYRSALAATKGKSLHAMELFNRQAADVMAGAHNVPEIEYQTNRLALLSNLETVWDQTAVTTIFVSVGDPVSGYEMAPTEENRQEVEAAVRYVADFFSLSVEGMLALPRVMDYIETMLVPAIKKSRKDFSCEVYVKETLATVAKCLKDKPPVAVSSGWDFVEMYGKKIPLGEWHLAIKNPPRPTQLAK